VSLEHKTKFTGDALNGYEAEIKIKNNGEIASDFKWDLLKVSD
jgi:hypothetical protein